MGRRAAGARTSAAGIPCETPHALIGCTLVVVLPLPCLLPSSRNWNGCVSLIGNLCQFSRFGRASPRVFGGAGQPTTAPRSGVFWSTAAFHSLAALEKRVPVPSRSSRPAKAVVVRPSHGESAGLRRAAELPRRPPPCKASRRGAAGSAVASAQCGQTRDPAGSALPPPERPRGACCHSHVGAMRAKRRQGFAQDVRSCAS